MQSTKIERQDAIFLLHKNTTKNRKGKNAREIYALLLLPDEEVKVDTVKSRDREMLPRNSVLSSLFPVSRCT